MANPLHVALLRGINVGGKNKVSMAELRSAFEAGGFGDVSTYIQSGNVVFSEPTRASSAPGELESNLEQLLQRQLGLDLVVVVRSAPRYRAVVAGAPDGFGEHPDRFHSDVVFLKAPLTGADAMRVVRTRDGVDRAWPGDGVVYFERLSERRTQSRLNRIMGTPEYRLMTIRNWATTTKLLALVEPD
jgi:uncharacterized protein (DUF1697 family)